MPVNEEQDVGRIGATTGLEVSQLTQTSAVGSSSDHLVADQHTRFLDRRSVLDDSHP